MISGAEIMVKCLEAEGVKVVFGYPGATICPFYDKIYDSTTIKHILVRQEQNAAHMASGYARCSASGIPGVCVATSGPGATNLITGIATAYTDSIPLVAITGQVRSDLLGRDVFQEADITGACEPLEILDRGWFTDASSRAMLVHSRCFGHAFEPQGEDVIGTEGIVTILNQLARYAKTKRVRIRVQDVSGRPAAGARVYLQLLNQAEYVNVAELTAGEDGTVSFTTGFGTLRVTAEQSGRALPGASENVLFLDPECTEAVLELREGETAAAEPAGDWTPVTFLAPPAFPVNPQQETPAQKAVGKQKLAAAAKKR